MKKLLGLVVVASLAVLLVGCGSKDAATASTPAAAGGAAAASTPGSAAAPDASKSGVEEVKIGQPGTR